MRCAFLALALMSGCAEAPEDAARRAASDTLAVLVAHHAEAPHPGGSWLLRGDGRFEFLLVSPGESGRWFVEHYRKRSESEPLSTEPFAQTLTTGAFADGVLTLDVAVAGSTRLHLCHFGRVEMLVPEGGVSFDDLSSARPAGAVFERAQDWSGSESLEPIRGYLPGPEDEQYGREGLPR